MARSGKCGFEAGRGLLSGVVPAWPSLCALLCAPLAGSLAHPLSASMLTASVLSVPALAQGTQPDDEKKFDAAIDEAYVAWKGKEWAKAKDAYERASKVSVDWFRLYRIQLAYVHLQLGEKTPGLKQLEAFEIDEQSRGNLKWADADAANPGDDSKPLKYAEVKKQLEALKESDKVPPSPPPRADSAPSIETAALIAEAKASASSLRTSDAFRIARLLAAIDDKSVAPRQIIVQVAPELGELEAAKQAAEELSKLTDGKERDIQRTIDEIERLRVRRDELVASAKKAVDANQPAAALSALSQLARLMPASDAFASLRLLAAALTDARAKPNAWVDKAKTAAARLDGDKATEAWERISGTGRSLDDPDVAIDAASHIPETLTQHADAMGNVAMIYAKRHDVERCVTILDNLDRRTTATELVSWYATASYLLADGSGDTVTQAQRLNRRAHIELLKLNSQYAQDMSDFHIAVSDIKLGHLERAIVLSRRIVEPAYRTWTIRDIVSEKYKLHGRDVAHTYIDQLASAIDKEAGLRTYSSLLIKDNDLRGATAQLQLADSAAADIEKPDWKAKVSANRAELWCRIGDLPHARELLNAAVSYRDSEPSKKQGDLHGAIASAARELRLATELEAWANRFKGDPQGGVKYASALAGIFVTKGDLDALEKLAQSWGDDLNAVGIYLVVAGHLHDTGDTDDSAKK